MKSISWIFLKRPPKLTINIHYPLSTMHSYSFYRYVLYTSFCFYGDFLEQIITKFRSMTSFFRSFIHTWNETWKLFHTLSRIQWNFVAEIILAIFTRKACRPHSYCLCYIVWKFYRIILYFLFFSFFGFCCCCCSSNRFKDLSKWKQKSKIPKWKIRNRNNMFRIRIGPFIGFNIIITSV